MNWKTKTLLISVTAGAITGLLASYILIQRAEQQKKVPKLSSKEGVKLGMGVLKLLQLVSELAKPKYG